MVSAMPGQEHAARRGDIQGLRALAVGLVVLAHAGVPGLSGGFIGVDVFFVISGYLITGLLLRERATHGRISIAGFYSRRARRILPAATLVLVVVVVLLAVTASAARASKAAHDAGWSALFLANVRFGRLGTDYFADQAPSPFQHFWSLAVEEQFYLVWPLLLVLLVGRLRRRGLLAVVGALLAASLARSIVMTAGAPVAAYFSSPSRAYELLAGALLAIAMDGRRLPTRLGGPAALAGLLVVVVASAGLDAGAPFPGYLALLPVTGAALLLAAGTAARPGVVSRALSARPFTFLGDISYSLYLWHWPVLVIGARWLSSGWPGAARTAVLVGTSVAIAALSYVVVERPFLRRGRRRPLLPGRRSLALWPAALASVAITGIVGQAYGARMEAAHQAEAGRWFAEHQATSRDVSPDPRATGAHGRALSARIGAALALMDEGAPVPPELDVAALGRDNWHRDYKCAAGFTDVTVRHCVYGDRHATTRVAVVGDSHAGHWLPALDLLGEREHFQLVPVIKVGCSAFDVEQHFAAMPQETCDAFRRWSRRELARLHPDVIVASTRAELWMEPSGGRTVDQQWTEGVRTGVRALTALAPVVDVFSDVPHRPDPADCLSAPDARQRDCATTERIPGTSANPVTEAALAGTGARWIDVVPLVCHRQRCPEVVGDRAVYYDDSHLSASWARHVAPALGELLGRPSPSRRS